MKSLSSLLFICLVPLGGRTSLSSIEELAVDGATLHYTVHGKGKPVLLLGGVPGLSSDYLVSVANELGKTHRCIIVDLRGTGKSSVKSIDTTTVNIQMTLGDLEALRKHLRIQSWTVMGHSSWGGILSMAYAAKFPQRVRGQILVGSGGPDLYFLEYFYSNIGARLTKEDSVKIGHIAETIWSTNRELAKVEQFKITMAAYVADRKHLPEVTLPITPSTYSPETAQIIWRSLFRQNYDQRARLKSFRGPTLVVQGRQDPIGARTAEDIQKVLTQARVEILENCGHFPWIEQKQKFYKSVTQFLKRLK